MSEPVTITITPTGVPAADLPMGMLLDVAATLKVHGLDLTAPELKGQGIVELMVALGAVLEATPVALGGRLEPPREIQRDARGWPVLGGAATELPDDNRPYDPRD